MLVSEKKKRLEINEQSICNRKYTEKQQRKIIEEKEIKARTKIVNFFSNLQTLNYYKAI